MRWLTVLGIVVVIPGQIIYAQKKSNVIENDPKRLDKEPKGAQTESKRTENDSKSPDKDPKGIQTESNPKSLDNEVQRPEIDPTKNVPESNITIEIDPTKFELQNPDWLRRYYYGLPYRRMYRRKNFPGHPHPQLFNIPSFPRMEMPGMPAMPDFNNMANKIHAQVAANMAEVEQNLAPVRQNAALQGMKGGQGGITLMTVKYTGEKFLIENKQAYLCKGTITMQMGKPSCQGQIEAVKDLCIPHGTGSTTMMEENGLICVGNNISIINGQCQGGMSGRIEDLKRKCGPDYKTDNYAEYSYYPSGGNGVQFDQQMCMRGGPQQGFCTFYSS